jgi:biotin synthase-related radical SAM superfamily protein
MPIQVQFEPPDDLRVLDEVRRAGVDAVGIHSETFDPDVLARVAPGKAQCGIEGYFRTWEAAVDVFGRGSVTTYVLLGHGRAAGADHRGCRRAISMGVYPFVVPLRPVPGTLMADAPPPDPTTSRDLRRGVGDAGRRGLRPSRCEGRLRALPGVLRAVGVGARAPARGGRGCRRRLVAARR